MSEIEQARPIAAEQPYPLLFATISGAHLYGFPSPDSDIDLRGVHILPVREVIGLNPGPATISATAWRNGIEIDLVTHDIQKFFGLLLKRNGYVLEQLYSPLIVHTTAEHGELKEIAHGCITRHHAHHYLGFSQTQWDLFCKTRSIKALLYFYRVLLTGIHLMRTGQVEANLVTLNEDFRLPYIAPLIDRKLHGAERDRIDDTDLAFHEHEHERLQSELEAARDGSSLPESPTARPDLNDLLIRVRLQSGG